MHRVVDMNVGIFSEKHDHPIIESYWQKSTEIIRTLRMFEKNYDPLKDDQNLLKIMRMKQEIVDINYYANHPQHKVVKNAIGIEHTITEEWFNSYKIGTSTIEETYNNLLELYGYSEEKFITRKEYKYSYYHPDEFFE